MKKSPSCVLVLHKTLNSVISRCRFADAGREMYKNTQRTCRAIVFAYLTYSFVAFSLHTRDALTKNRSLDIGRSPLTRTK